MNKYWMDERRRFYVGWIKRLRLEALGSMNPHLTARTVIPRPILSVTKRRRFIPRLRGGPAAPLNRHTGQNRRKEPTLNRLRSKDQERRSQEAVDHRASRTLDPAAPMKMGPRPQPTSLTYKRSLTPAGSHTLRRSISFSFFSSLRVGLV
jgi:hypothetical protein